MALRASIGQYYSANSAIHRLDPRAKLVATVAFMVSCFCALLGRTRHGGSCRGLMRRSGKRAGGPAAIPNQAHCAFPLYHIVYQPVFVQTGQELVGFGPIRIFSGGVEAAILYTVRFFCCLSQDLCLCSPPRPRRLPMARQTTRPLECLGVPVSQGALVLSIALRFVPTLAQEADNIVAAQTARGADLENKGALAYARACVPLVVPLFASALRHADNLGRALDARCYTGGASRTHYHEMRFSPRADGPFAAACLAYLAALCAINLLGI